eukprot:CAMPEP_0178402330 /NCGR_PEP_ID=MMETSP0689_2-20121128/16782_1 /TAXON_ID=160604 /ORGANISM="Amphidinium massartii, Strain CS-259" /LENGTH=522 /DNA_ID=CAMNT_0020023219 /DNA_START=185 /DNA_END=1753 /DNA_ORIENTATION=+
MLRIASALAFSLVGAGATSQQAIDTTVVVIGGGPAGIAAAVELQANGVDFVLLEARDILGGRVRSQQFGGYDWHPGAEWIHGKERSDGGELNPIYSLATQAGVSWALTDYENVTVRNRSGSMLSPSLVDQWWRRIDAVKAYCLEKNDALWTAADDLDVPESIDITLAACWDEYGYFTNATDQESMDLANLLQWEEIDFEFTNRPNELGVMWSLPTNADYNDADHLITGSYPGILESIANTLPTSAVKTGQMVTMVNYTGPFVQVMTEQGLTVNASAVVCTLPLGVLQKRTVTWDPPMSAERLSAIDKMIMGNYVKAVLQFPSVFWDSTELSFYSGDFASGIVKLAVNFDHDKLKPGSKMLEIHITGTQAKSIEDGTVAEAQARIMTELRNVYGEGIPEPTAFAVTNWTYDPYAYGTWSSWPYGFLEEEWLQITSSLNDLVFFAGEHTSDNFGFVHSAWDSGKAIVQDSVLSAIGVTPSTTVADGSLQDDAVVSGGHRSLFSSFVATLAAMTAVIASSRTAVV